MEKMIPSNATGVICIKVPNFIKKAKLDKGGDCVLPDQLKSVIDKHDGSLMSEVMSDLPKSGLDFGDNVYFFYSQGTFRYVCLATLDDADAAKQLLEYRTGGKFKQVDDVDYLGYQAYSFVIDDDVLLIGRDNYVADEKARTDAARLIFSKTQRSIRDIDDIKDCIDRDNDINAYFDIKGLNAMLQAIPSFKNAMQQYPFLSIITDSDIKAFVMGMKFEDNGASCTAQIKADAHSDYVTLLSATLAKPDNEFLKGIPSSMKYLFSVSVKGEKFVQLDQIRKSINLLSNLPSMDKLDVRGIVRSIDGPIAFAMAPSFLAGDSDATFIDDWNMAIAFKSTHPQLVVKSIVKFADEMGQPDMLKDGKHLFNYQGMPVLVWAEGSTVCVTRLDHELVEGSFYDSSADLKDRFASSPIGFYVQSDVDSTKG
ncbi:MAG: DUF4836 family protein, partial [Muribaculaceae bacterium]|nr:DUF4836 family protein [Muribaculaceae bacterium]